MSLIPLEDNPARPNKPGNHFPKAIQAHRVAAIVAAGPARTGLLLIHRLLRISSLIASRQQPPSIRNSTSASFPMGS